MKFDVEFCLINNIHAKYIVYMNIWPRYSGFKLVKNTKIDKTRSVQKNSKNTFHSNLLLSKSSVLRFLSIDALKPKKRKNWKNALMLLSEVAVFVFARLDPFIRVLPS